jgi:hypothetical protein
MLLLISSNIARRYSDDIVRLLALPSGAEIQFRYDEKYLDSAVLQRAREGKLNQENALVCFMMADAEARKTQLVSCRAVTVSRSAIVGSSCILTLVAAEYVYPLDDEAIRKKLSSNELALVPAYAGDAKVPAGKFVIEVHATLHGAKIAAPKDSVDAFEQTTAHLSAFETFAPTKRIAFFAIRGMIAPDQQTSFFRRRAPSPATFSHGAYELMCGVHYELLVYTYRPAGSAIEAASTKLTIDSNEKAVRFTSNKQIVLDSRYDLHRFAFTTDDRLEALPAGLTVALSVDDTARARTVSERCDITLRVRFGGRRLEALIRVFVITAGTSSSAIIGILNKDHFSFLVGAIMCVGPLIAAYAATFPVLRRTD